MTSLLRFLPKGLSRAEEDTLGKCQTSALQPNPPLPSSSQRKIQVFLLSRTRLSRQVIQLCVQSCPFLCFAHETVLDSFPEWLFRVFLAPMFHFSEVLPLNKKRDGNLAGAWELGSREERKMPDCPCGLILLNL